MAQGESERRGWVFKHHELPVGEKGAQVTESRSARPAAWLAALSRIDDRRTSDDESGCYGVACAWVTDSADRLRPIVIASITSCVPVL